MLKKVLYLILIMLIIGWSSFTYLWKKGLFEQYRTDFFLIILFIICFGIFYSLIEYKHTKKSYEAAKKLRKVSLGVFAFCLLIYVGGTYAMVHYNTINTTALYVGFIFVFFAFTWMMYCYSENVKEEDDDDDEIL